MTDDNKHNRMRDFIEITELLEYYKGEETVEAESLVETQQVGNSLLFADLERLVVKMQSIMESSGGDYALGFETGMQRAAEMLENTIKHHRGE